MRLFFLKAKRKKRVGDCIWEDKTSFKRLMEKKEPKRLRGQSEKKRTREELVPGEPREPVFKTRNGQQIQMLQKACDRGTREVGDPQRDPKCSMVTLTVGIFFSFRD